ncbi:MAG TPA: HdeD family acid-resistance protein [Ktedonobacterales bacterium]|nr:HdeD family acid-resistance protein [Ktedonobacterales bacterium]
METLLTRHWWAVGLRGLAAVVFGILALVVPGITLIVLIAFFGAYVLIDGVITAYLAIRGRETIRNWGWLLVEGIAGILIGILTFRWPGVTGLVLLAFIAAWAIITGIMEIFQAIELRRVINNEWLLILSGAASVIFGLLLIIFPGAGALALVWLIGIYAIIFGALLLVLAWRLRQMAQGAQAIGQVS